MRRALAFSRKSNLRPVRPTGSGCTGAHRQAAARHTGFQAYSPANKHSGGFSEEGNSPTTCILKTDLTAVWKERRSRAGIQVRHGGGHSGGENEWILQVWEKDIMDWQEE